MLLSLGLWVGGVALLALGLLRLRGPLARYRDLKATQENLTRYDDWRGNRLRPEPGERTGADVMLELLRRRTLLWGAVAGVGVVLIVAGFALG